MGCGSCACGCGHDFSEGEKCWMHPTTRLVYTPAHFPFEKATQIKTAEQFKAAIEAASRCGEICINVPDDLTPKQRAAVQKVQVAIRVGAQRLRCGGK